MRKLSLLLAMLLLAATTSIVGPVTEPAEAQGANSPIGRIDQWGVGGGKVVAHGWTLDPDTRASIVVHMYVDGQFTASTRADVNRPDVDRVHGKGAAHGFAIEAPIGAGSHNVCLYGINAGPGPNTRLGCRSVRGRGRADATGGLTPIGQIESISVDGNTATLSGWALDGDTNRPINIHVYVDKEFHSGKKARGKRADLAQIYGRGARHGWGVPLNLSDGTHTVCVYAIDDAKIRGNNKRLGCRSISVGVDNRGGPGVVITPTGIVTPVIEAGVGGSYRVLTPCLNEATVTGTFVPGTQVVVDPGHGGRESGAVGPNGLVEKEVNLSIARRVKAILEARGYSVVITRTTDVRLPLLYRAEIANALKPDVFVSLHHNGGAVRPQQDPGTETFYQHDSPESRRLAGILYEEISAAMDRFGSNFVGTVRNGANTRLREDGSDLYGIHRFTPDVVSVITEALYLSHRPEAEMLARADVRDAQAVAIVDGIIRFLTTADEGSGYNGSFTDPTSTGTGGTDNCTDPRLQ